LSVKLDYVSVQINLYGKPGLYKPRGAGSVIKTTLAQRVSDFDIMSTLKTTETVTFKNMRQTEA